VDSSWPDGFVASIRLTNTGTSPVSNWTLTWTAASGQGLVNGWGATVSQSGSTVTARASSWAQPVGPGATWTVGYQGSGPASPTPTGFALDGRPCPTGQ
jgi:endoglucanase